VMSKSVFAQEWVLLRHNPTWWAIFVLLLLLTIVAAFNGTARYKQVAEVVDSLNMDELATQSALQDSVARYEMNPVGNPPAVTSAGTVGLSLLGHYAIFPLDPLAALAVGQSDVQPTYYRVTAHPSHTFLTATEIQNPVNVLYGSFDVAFVIVFLLPIFIIALTFDLMSKEKERGVLGLVIAHGVSLKGFIVAKCLARALLIFLILLVLGVVALVLTGAELGNAAVWARFSLWFSVVALYAFFWFALALFVNAWNQASVTNGVVLANLWLVFVVVLPAFANIVATTLYPAPSRVKLTTEMREAAELAEQQAAESREAYYFDHPELSGDSAVADAFFIQVLATDAAVERVVAPLMQEFDVQAASRQDVVELIQFTSPAIMVQNALNLIAGTGSEHFQDFNAQVINFHERWRGFFTGRILRGEPMTASAFDNIPRYIHEPRGVGILAAGVTGPLVGLAFFVILIAASAIRRYSRYPVV